MKQIIAAALAVLALCAVLVACGSDSSKDADPTKAAGIVIPTDAEGETIYPVDEKGYPVYPTDAEGEPVYATDEAGDPIMAHDASGNPITGNNGVTETQPASPSSRADDNPDQPSPATDPATASPDPTGASDSTGAPATEQTPEPGEDVTEGEIPVIIATMPDDDDEYELPILP